MCLLFSFHFFILKFLSFLLFLAYSSRTCLMAALHVLSRDRVHLVSWWNYARLNRSIPCAHFAVLTATPSHRHQVLCVSVCWLGRARSWVVYTGVFVRVQLNVEARARARAYVFIFLHYGGQLHRPEETRNQNKMFDNLFCSKDCSREAPSTASYWSSRMRAVPSS